MAVPNLDAGPSFEFSRVTFDNGDYLNRGADLTGTINAISRASFAFSVTFDTLPTGGAPQTLLVADDTVADLSCSIIFNGANLNLGFADTSFTAGTNGQASIPFVPVLGVKYNILLSINCSTEVITCSINGVDVPPLAYVLLSSNPIDLSTNVSNWRIGRSFAATQQFLGKIGLLYVVFGTTDAAYLTDPTLFFDGSSDREFFSDIGGLIPNPIIFFGYDQTFTNWNAGTARAPATGGNWSMVGAVAAA
jgi:hypothetical protein